MKAGIVEDEMHSSEHRRRWLTPVLIFGLWTFFGLFYASQAIAVLDSASRTPPEITAGKWSPSWFELLYLCLAECYVWAVMAWFISRLARRFPLGQGHWRLGLAVHIPASIIAALIQTVIMTAVSEVLRRDLPKPTYSLEVLELYFVAKFHQNIFFYWVILAVFQALVYYRKYRDRELRTSRLEARLAEARLQVLKMQLHPHFLFNTLNAISALMHQDVELADRMIARLGDLLRTTLDSANKQEVSLQQELDFIRPYLEIEQARLGSRLSVRMDIEPEAMDALVPNLLLQPLVENAVRHGVAPRPGPGQISIRARRVADQLCLQVIDDGPGVSPTAIEKEGVGLGNTRARLQQLYGGAHQFVLSNGAGLTVSVTLPFRDATGNPSDVGARP